jgi:hypothetical protein
LEFANTSGLTSNNTFYSSHLDSWLKLNNIGGLDDYFRVYINDIEKKLVYEYFGNPINN